MFFAWAEQHQQKTAPCEPAVISAHLVAKISSSVIVSFEFSIFHLDFFSFYAFFSLKLVVPSE